MDKVVDKICHFLTAAMDMAWITVPCWGALVALLIHSWLLNWVFGMHQAPLGTGSGLCSPLTEEIVVYTILCHQLQ